MTEGRDKSPGELTIICPRWGAALMRPKDVPSGRLRCDQCNAIFGFPGRVPGETPPAITVVGWVLIALGIILAVLGALMLRDSGWVDSEDPVLEQILMSLAEIRVKMFGLGLFVGGLIVVAIGGRCRNAKMPGKDG